MGAPCGVLAVVLASVLAGCAAGPPQPLPVVASATQPRNTAVTTPPTSTAVASSTTAPAATTPAPPPTTARGNVTLDLGRPAVGRAGDRDAGWTVTVEDVTARPPCPEVATRGQLLAARVRLDTTPGYDSTQPAPPALSDLTVVSPDGTVTGGLDTSPARSCDPGSERAPASVRPGASYTFTVVLDSPVAAGMLAYHPDTQPTGWEWPFPRAEG
ncbi:hypothetical protein GCM10027047_12240 [Rhodococcus aerolatus]